MSKSMTPKLSNATADGNGASVSFRFLNGVLVTEVLVSGYTVPEVSPVSLEA